MKPNDILLAHDFGGNCYYFLQVVKATEKTVTVRRIESNKREGTPMPNNFCSGIFGHPLNKRVNDGRIRMSDYTTARLWDGEPLHEEHPIWGTNYNLY